MGTFYKALLGVVAMLVVGSHGLNCDIKVESSHSLSLANQANPIIDKTFPFPVDIKFEKECDGICVRAIGVFRNVSSNVDQNFELAGCQNVTDVPNGDVFMALNFGGIAFGSMKYGLLGCKTDNCNAVEHTHRERLVNIQKIVEEETKKFKTTFSNQPLCKNENETNSSVCLGVCTLSRPGLGKHSWSGCDNSDGGNVYDYGSFIHAEATLKHSETRVSAWCSSDNCNAQGSTADQSVYDMKKKRVFNPLFFAKHPKITVIAGEFVKATNPPAKPNHGSNKTEGAEQSSTANPDVRTTPGKSSSTIGLMLPLFFISMTFTTIIA